MPSACAGPGAILHTQEPECRCVLELSGYRNPRAAIHTTHTIVIGLQASGLFQSPEGDHSMQSRADPVLFDIAHQHEMSWTCGSCSNADF